MGESVAPLPTRVSPSVVRATCSNCSGRPESNERLQDQNTVKSRASDLYATQKADVAFRDVKREPVV